MKGFVLQVSQKYVKYISVLYVIMIYAIIATDDCLSTFFSLKVATCLLYNIFIFYSKLKKYKYFLDSVRILYPAATRITIHVLLLLF